MEKTQKRQTAPAMRGNGNGQRGRQAAIGGRPVTAPGNSGGGAGQKAKKHFRPYHSINVPRRVDLETQVDQTEVTTIMLRNIPNRYTQMSLIEEINGVGFEGRYDFFYLPMDVHNRTNVGYAFINFVTPKDASAFLTEFGNYMFKRHSSHKIAGVSPAHMQGLVKNIQHFLPRAVTQSRDACYRPAVFLDGRRLELQEALEELQQVKKPVAAAQADGLLQKPPGIDAPFAAPLGHDGVSFPYRPQLRPAPGLSGPFDAGRVSGASDDSTSDLNPLAAAYVPLTGPPAETVAFPGNTCTEGWKDEAFVGARRAFEDALSSLLQDPLQFKTRQHSGADTIDTLNGSGSGTPRSESSADGWSQGGLDTTPTGAHRKSEAVPGSPPNFSSTLGA